MALEGLGKFDAKGLMGGAGNFLASGSTLLHGTGDMEADERGAAIGGTIGGAVGMAAQAFIPIPGLGEAIGQVGTLVGGLAGKGKARRDAAAKAAAEAGRTYGGFHEQENVNPYGAGNSAYMAEEGGMADMGLSMFMLNTKLPVKAKVNPLDTKLMTEHGYVPGSVTPFDISSAVESYADGGIHIKPENRGKFTSWATAHGMTVSEAANKVMKDKNSYSPTIVKRANFAKNAAGWRKAEGGLNEGGGEDPIPPKKKVAPVYGPDVFGSEDELYKANQQARFDALRKIDPNDKDQVWLAQNTVVGRRVGDAKPKYVGDVGRTTMPRATTLPYGVTIDDIENTSDGYGYWHPQNGNFVTVDPAAIYGRYGAKTKNINPLTPTGTEMAKFKKGGATDDYYAGGGYVDDEIELMKKGGWIKKAVNPAHKGYCTPMTKRTCTPRRKALARTFKKHHGFHKGEDGMLTDSNQDAMLEQQGIPESMQQA